MEWGTPVEYVSNAHFKEGIFLGYESHGGRINEERSVIVQKDRSRPIFVDTDNVIPLRNKQESSDDFDKKVWEPFKEE